MGGDADVWVLRIETRAEAELVAHRLSELLPEPFGWAVALRPAGPSPRAVTRHDLTQPRGLLVPGAQEVGSSNLPTPTT